MKFKTFLITFLCAFILSNLKAQSYNASLIPDTLTKNANAVKREEELKIVIKDIDKAVIQRKYAITILNENGARYGVYGNSYDKLRSLSDIDGNLYDATGKQLKNVHLPKSPIAREEAIELNDLRKGVYFAKISSENGSVVKKVIKD